MMFMSGFGVSSPVDANVRKLWRRLRGLLLVAGYGLLAVFLLALAYLTTQYGGPLSDWKSIVTVLALVMMFGVVGWLAATSWRER